MHGELDYVTITRSHEGTVRTQPTGTFKVNTRPVPGAGYNDHFWHLNDARTETAPMLYGTVYDLRFQITPTPGDETTTEALKLESSAFHPDPQTAVEGMR